MDAPTNDDVRARDTWVEEVTSLIVSNGVTFLFEHSDGVRAIEMELRRVGRPSMIEQYRQMLDHVEAFAAVFGSTKDPELRELVDFYRSLPPPGPAMRTPIPMPVPTSAVVDDWTRDLRAHIEAVVEYAVLRARADAVEGTELEGEDEIIADAMRLVGLPDEAA